MHNLFRLLPVIAFFIVHLTASADSCRYASNRFHIGLDISDPFKMAFADKGTRVRTFEATLRYHASWLVVLQVSGGIYRLAQNEFTHGRNDLETQYFSCGPLFTVGKSPYRRPFRLELGMMYSMNSVKIDYFRTLEDHLKESLPVVITEKYNLELIQMEMGGVLRLSKRFRLRGYMDMGVVISYAKPPSYERFIPGAGTNLVTSGFDLPPILLRGGAMLLFNLFPQRDCNIDDAPKRSKRK